MKHFSRSLAVLTIAMVAFITTTSAGPIDSTVQSRIVSLSMKNFRLSLKSDIPGVVEGTISDVVVFKKLYPDLDFDGIVDRLNEVAETSKVPVISYKAHLASMYLAHPAQFEIVVPNENPERQDDVFRQIMNQLQKQLVERGANNAMSSN